MFKTTDGGIVQSVREYLHHVESIHSITRHDKRLIRMVTNKIAMYLGLESLNVDTLTDVLIFLFKQRKKNVDREKVIDTLREMFYVSQGYVHVGCVEGTPKHTDQWVTLYLFYSQVNPECIYSTEDIYNSFVELSDKVKEWLTIRKLYKVLNKLNRMGAIVKIEDHLRKDTRYKVYWCHPDVVPILEESKYFERVPGHLKYVVRKKL